MQQASPLKIFPGQCRPLVFCITYTGSKLSEFNLHLWYSLYGREFSSHRKSIKVRLKQSSVFQPHRITYLHPSGIVSYAILRPPLKAAWRKDAQPLPVALVLHGAGLDVDSSIARHVLDECPDLAAWILIPSGVTDWSGDDWREPLHISARSKAHRK